MKFRTSGQIRRVDLAPIVGLLPAVRDEWAGLRFRGDGPVMNPITGEPVDRLRLVHGRHRQVGAAYRIITETPRLELPDSRRDEFDTEARKLSSGRAKQDEWSDHHRRRREASVQVGVDEAHHDAILKHDNSHRLAFSVSDEHARWTIDVDVTHDRLPRVEVTGQVDLTAALKSEGTPGCFAGLLGGKGEGQAVLDAAVLDRSGQAIESKGRANRFSGSANVAVKASSTTWTVDGLVIVRARGLGRLVLLVFGRRIRRSFDSGMQTFWTTSDVQVSDLERELVQLKAATDGEGGPAPFVHRALWDERFDPGLSTLLP